MRATSRLIIATAFAALPRLVAAQGTSPVAAFQIEPASPAAQPTSPAAPAASAYSPQGADTCLGCHNNAGVTGLGKCRSTRSV